jgi:hypothetical protein
MGLPFDWYLPPRTWPTGLPYTDATVQSTDDASMVCDVQESDELDWRAQDAAQRLLENARYLWLGFIGRTQDSVVSTAQSCVLAWEDMVCQLRGTEGQLQQGA